MCVKPDITDMKNGYNEVKRSTVAAELEAAPLLRGLVPFFRATHQGASKIFLAAPDMPQADFSSDKGCSKATH